MGENRWNAERYDEQVPFVSAAAKDLVTLLAPRAGERILDLGCGTGDLTADLAAAGASVVGLDASSEMVSRARAKFPALTFVAGKAERLEYRDEFDGVFSNAVLHWVSEAGEVAGGVHRALKPGGRFVAEFGGARNVATIARAVREVLTERGENPEAWLRWYFPTPEEYARLLESRGFGKITTSYFERPTPMPGGELGLRDWLRMFMSALVEKLGADVEGFFDDIEGRCRGALFKDGTWTVDYVRLRVRAFK